MSGGGGGGGRSGPPKHQNNFTWKPNSGRTINPTEVGGSFRPYSEVTGVCSRCKEQIEWKRKYGKYKPLTEPSKCQKCSKRNVRQAYHNLCNGCAKEQHVCAKCSRPVGHIIGRDISEVEAEHKTLEEAIKNARERERRTLLRTMIRAKLEGIGVATEKQEKKRKKQVVEHKWDVMNKGKSQSATLTPTKDNSKVGELFTASSLDEYAEFSRDDEDDYSNDEEPRIVS